MSHDVVVVGGGVIGLACARRLARDGRAVAVVEAGELGREASWAAGGILSPVHPHAYPPALTALVERSVRLYPALSAELLEESGVSIELRTTGLLRVAVSPSDDDELARTLRFRAERGLRAERLEPTDARTLVPGLAPRASSFVFEPEISQVRNPRLLRALAGAGARAGVAFFPREPVLELVRAGSRVTGVRTQRRTLHAGEVVLAAGAWSGDLARSMLGLELAVEPVRGQMLLLDAPPGTLATMVLGAGGRYLIPRADGRILVGSTLERAGFDKRTTVEGVAGLLGAALELVPSLADARLEQAWAGLRPGTRDRLPYLGRVSGLEGLVVATGHYRNGIVLAPVTAELVGRLLAGEDVARELEPFAPGRAVGPPAPD
jgi:glycine oxidase